MSTKDVVYEHEKIGKITQSHVLIKKESYNLSEIGKAEYVSLLGTKCWCFIAATACLAIYGNLPSFIPVLILYASCICLKGQIDIYNKNGAKIGSHTFYMLSLDFPVEDFALNINRNIKS